MTYLPGHEADAVRKKLLEMVEEQRQATGQVPIMVSVLLRPGDEGEDQTPISFMLVKRPEGLFYETVEGVEINGVPGNTFQIPLAELKPGRKRKGCKAPKDIMRDPDGPK